jgi:hypothetical protein
MLEWHIPNLLRDIALDDFVRNKNLTILYKTCL